MKVPPAQKIRDLTESSLSCSQAWEDPGKDGWVWHAPMTAMWLGMGYLRDLRTLVWGERWGQQKEESQDRPYVKMWALHETLMFSPAYRK